MIHLYRHPTPTQQYRTIKGALLRSEAEPANAPLGSDGAGTVAAMGNGVERINPGDRVYAFGLVNPKGGFYAEYAAIKADDVSPIPGKLVLQTA